MTAIARDPRWQQLYLVASKQHGLFCLAQALRLGIGMRLIGYQIKQGRIERVGHGCYRVAAVPVTREQQIMAACLGRSDTVASHSSAVHLWGAELTRSADQFQCVEVTTSWARSSRVGAGVVVHRTSRPSDGSRRMMRRSIPVTSPERTVLDLAARLTSEHLAQLVALRHLTISRLTRELHRAGGRGVSGSERLHGVLKELGEGPAWESVIEAEVLRFLLSRHLPRPSLQYVIRQTGRPVGRVDFAWPSARVALEVDGFRWHADPRTYRYDRTRGNRIVAAGWQLLRTTPAEVRQNPESLFRTLEQVLRLANPAR